jgi:hypothetical protein
MKTITSLMLLVCLMASCKKSIEYCWTFTTTQTTTVSPPTSGWPQSASSVYDQCGLTEKEAEQVCKDGSSTSTSSAGGYMVTVTTKVSKKKK